MTLRQSGGTELQLAEGMREPIARWVRCMKRGEGCHGTRLGRRESTSAVLSWGTQLPSTSWAECTISVAVWGETIGLPTSG